VSWIGPTAQERKRGKEKGKRKKRKKDFADLDRPVAGVDDAQPGPRPTRAGGDRAGGGQHLAGYGGPFRVGGVSGRIAGADRVVDGHQLRAVREGRLDLHLGQQGGDPGQHVVRRQHLATGLHQVGHGAAVASGLQHERAQHRDRLGVVEAQSATTPSPGQLGGVGDHQALLLVRGQQHRAPRAIRRSG